MNVEAACGDAYKPCPSTEFPCHERLDSAAETCFDHHFLGRLLSGVVLVPCQVVELLPALVHGQGGLDSSPLLGRAPG